MKAVIKTIFKSVMPIGILSLLILLCACPKKRPTDSQIGVTVSNIKINTQENFDIDNLQKLASNDATFDLGYISDLTFGGISEILFGANTTERKMVFTNNAIFDAIDNVQKLKDNINNATTKTAFVNKSYLLEPGYSTLESTFFSFTTNNGRLCLVRINPYTIPTLEISLTIIAANFE